MRTADVAARPWRNGGGVTRELLAHPEGGDWRVRVSVADIEADGPFSTFAGVARWFAVLDGAGVVLTIDGSEHRCTPADDALAFAGDAETTCRLVDGATRDLNLMLRGVRGELAKVVNDTAWRPSARACGLYATAAGRCRAFVRDDPGSAAQSTGNAGAEAVPAHALRWWTSAPDALAFDGAGWWLAADLGATP